MSDADGAAIQRVPYKLPFLWSLYTQFWLVLVISGLPMPDHVSAQIAKAIRKSMRPDRK
jgi:hypothetical protein